MIEIICNFLAAMAGGAVTGIATIAVLKNDVRWLKEIIAEHGTRLTFIERNI